LDGKDVAPEQVGQHDRRQERVHLVVRVDRVRAVVRPLLLVVLALEEPEEPCGHEEEEALGHPARARPRPERPRLQSCAQEKHDHLVRENAGRDVGLAQLVNSHRVDDQGVGVPDESILGPIASSTGNN